MKAVGFVVCALFLLSSSTGCAARTAFDMAEPVRHDLIEVGMSTRRVETLLEPGLLTQAVWVEPGHREYEYSDGPHEHWKARGFFYLFADVVTLFSSELILWPVELVVRGLARRGGIAYYDEKGALLYFQAVRGRADIEVMSIGQKPTEIVISSDVPGATEKPESEALEATAVSKFVFGSGESR